ncbi:MAG: glycosyltransferase family 4 protein [Candidatus Rokubacteria bacterium]|nr:glycosyltransferase family 4 protein [Candidatus Rokubacteria bacterium]MBI3109393.1 glycosyltransferase family 4 protein [Candidatus Rokubacteria bacterium]
MTGAVRIAFLTTEYPTEQVFAGGLAAYVQRVAHALVQAGHEPEVFTLSDRTERTLDGPVPVHRVTEAQGWAARARRIPLAWRLDDFLELAGSTLRLARALRLRHREAPFAVVQASNFRAPGLGAAVRRVAPLVTRISSIEILWRRAYARPPGAAARLQGWAEAWQVRHSAAAYAPSHLLAAAASEAFGRTVRVIEPPFAVAQHAAMVGSPPAEFPPETYALFFGTIGLLKGGDRLVRVLPGILDRRPEFRFVFVGRVFRTAAGEPFDAYIARALGAYGKRIVVLSERPRADLFPLVAGARVVVLPSRVDNLPNACLEAMALERVVVATEGASFEQLITHGESGLLVPQEDDGALEAGILAAWDLPAEPRRLMGRAARARIERLDPRLTIVALEALFAEVTGAR